MGTAQAVYSPSQGLLWATGPVGYALTLIVGKWVTKETPMGIAIKVVVLADMEAC